MYERHKLDSLVFSLGDLSTEHSGPIWGVKGTNYYLASFVGFRLFYGSNASIWVLMSLISYFFLIFSLNGLSTEHSGQFRAVKGKKYYLAR